MSLGSTVLPVFLLIVVYTILVPMAVWSLECAAALLPPRARRLPDGARRPTLAVLVPAHNEALGILRTLASLAPQILPGDRVVVIADNCSDATADIARQAGVVVLERHDLLFRGKSYVLDYAVRSLEKDAPEVFVVIDADCTVYPGALDSLARLAFAAGRPVQASYVLESSAGSNPLQRLAVMAFQVKNFVRPRGLDRMGLPCFLNGSGMGFPAAIIQSPMLASGSIVEDIWLTVDLILAGHAPMFCPEAKVTSPLPGQNRARVSQSTRWWSGRLECMRLQGPRLLLGAIRQRRFDCFTALLDLCVLPLSLLMLVWLTVLSGAVAAGLLGFAWLPAITVVMGGLVMALTFGGVLLRFGEKGLARAIWAAPFYVVSKLPIYATIAIRRQKGWTPTERDPIPPPE